VALPWSLEADIGAELEKLPPGFLPEYANWAMQQTDAPLWYHVGCAFGLLATVAPLRYIMRGGPGGRLETNFFGMVVGRQGYERKSTATGLATRLLEQALPNRVGIEPGSGEGFVQGLADHPQQLLEISEYGDFLSKTRARSGGNYQAEIKKKLMPAWDGRRLSRKLSRRSVVCQHPRLNILAAINQALLASESEWHDWEGGLNSRYCIFFSYRERRQGLGRGNPDLEDALVDWLKSVASAPESMYGRCTGLTTAAEREWTEFNIAIDESGLLLPDDKFVGVYSRAPVHALKMAVLIELSQGSGFPSQPPGSLQPIAGQDFTVGLRSMRIAIDFATRCFMGAVAIFSGVEGTRDMQNRRKVLDAIGDEWTPIGKITRRAQLLKKALYPIIETLVSEGLIEESREYGLEKGRARAYRSKFGVVTVSGVQTALEIKAAVDKTLEEVRSGKFNLTEAAQKVSVSDMEQKLPLPATSSPFGPAGDNGFDPTPAGNGADITLDFSSISDSGSDFSSSVSSDLRKAFAQPDHGEGNVGTGKSR